jgi:hypothetical protein
MPLEADFSVVDDAPNVAGIWSIELAMMMKKRRLLERLT